MFAGGYNKDRDATCVFIYVVERKPESVVRWKLKDELSSHSKTATESNDLSFVFFI